MSLEWTAQGSYINYFDGFFYVEHINMDRISYKNKFCKKKINYWRKMKEFDLNRNRRMMVYVEVSMPPVCNVIRRCDLYFEKYHGTTQNEAHIHGQQWVKLPWMGNEQLHV